MTREQFAQSAFWRIFMTLIGILNTTCMVPELFRIWSTRDASGLSLSTLCTILIIQVAFGVHGYLIRDRIGPVSNTIASSVTCALGGSTIYLRYIVA